MRKLLLACFNFHRHKQAHTRWLTLFFCLSFFENRQAVNMCLDVLKVFCWHKKPPQNMYYDGLCHTSRKPLKIHHENHPGIQELTFSLNLQCPSILNKKFITSQKILPFHLRFTHLLQPLVSAEWLLFGTSQFLQGLSGAPMIDSLLSSFFT